MGAQPGVAVLLRAGLKPGTMKTNDIRKRSSGAALLIDRTYGAPKVLMRPGDIG